VWLSAGASLGAYHAANIAFRHPDAVSHLISLSGSFDISSFFDGYHDDNIYFNSPYEYLPNLPDPWKYNHMGIVLGTGEWTNTRHETYRLSEILNSKGVKHWLDDGKWRGHDWNYWRDMLPSIVRLCLFAPMSRVVRFGCFAESSIRFARSMTDMNLMRLAPAERSICKGCLPDRLCRERGSSGHERVRKTGCEAGAR
jgi:pimeloyl-ACP methyl ester carboxylesterase